MSPRISGQRVRQNSSLTIRANEVATARYDGRSYAFLISRDCTAEGGATPAHGSGGVSQTACAVPEQIAVRPPTFVVFQQGNRDCILL